MQSSQNLFITLRDRTQQPVLISLPGAVSHLRSRSRTLMHTLSRQQAGSVPIFKGTPVGIPSSADTPAKLSYRATDPGCPYESVTAPRVFVTNRGRGNAVVRPYGTWPW